MRVISIKSGLAHGLAAAFLLWLGLPGGGEFWPVLAIALVPLFSLLRLPTAKQRLLCGLGVGTVHFLLQLYWIVIVLGRYGGLDWFVAYPATVLLALYMAIYMALFFVVGGGVWQKWGAAVALWTAPVLWVGLDWLRGVLFSGLPWMDLGYGLWRAPLLLQAADLFGHHLLTFLVVLVNSAIFFTIVRRQEQGIWKHLACVVLIVGATAGYGWMRADGVEAELAGSERITVGVVQGNIDQSRKWSPDEQQHTIEIYLTQTISLFEKADQPELVVWPETALPFFPARNPLYSALPLLAQRFDTPLLTGTPWYEIVDAENRLVNYFNGALLVTPEGGEATYFKSHLVPFGEYVPLKKILFFLGPLVEAVGDFTPGKIEQPLRYGQVKAGVLICYESIFGDIGRKWSQAGANVLINLTNDAWYGRSSAPRQSMAMSVLRAVENRRSLVRAANTGISGFVDPLGRVKKSSPIFVLWVETAEVELTEMATVYSRYGYFFAPVCFFLSCAMTLMIRWGQQMR